MGPYQPEDKSPGTHARLQAGPVPNPILLAPLACLPPFCLPPLGIYFTSSLTLALSPLDHRHPLMPLGFAFQFACQVPAHPLSQGKKLAGCLLSLSLSPSVVSPSISLPSLHHTAESAVGV